MNECILVVDDDAEIVGAIAITLEREGYRCLKAYDGLQALDLCLDPAVKLILIDSFDQPGAPREMSYFVQGDHIDRWEYSPAACARKIVTDFSAVRAQ